MTTSTDSIIRLRMAFATVPMKGLFFWEGLLNLNDEEYKEIVENSFIDEIKSFPKKEKEAVEYYNQILADLRAVRKDILKNPEIKKEVEKFREALIDQATYKMVIDSMKKNLSSQEEKLTK
ncbi:hypothetical protein GAMM_60005 [Gammaproteobacteria bacterium]